MWWSGDIWKKNPAPRLLHFTGQVVAPFPTAIAELHQISNGECRSQMWPMLSKFPLHFGGGIFYFFPFTSFTSSTWLLRCLLHSWSRSGHWNKRDVFLCWLFKRLKSPHFFRHGSIGPSLYQLILKCIFIQLGPSLDCLVHDLIKHSSMIFNRALNNSISHYLPPPDPWHPSRSSSSRGSPSRDFCLWAGGSNVFFWWIHLHKKINYL